MTGRVNSKPRTAPARAGYLNVLLSGQPAAIASPQNPPDAGREDEGNDGNTQGVEVRAVVERHRNEGDKGIGMATARIADGREW